MFSGRVLLRLVCDNMGRDPHQRVYFQQLTHQTDHKRVEFTRFDCESTTSMAGTPTDNVYFSPEIEAQPYDIDETGAHVYKCDVECDLRAEEVRLVENTARLSNQFKQQSHLQESISETQNSIFESRAMIMQLRAQVQRKFGEVR